MHSWCVATGFQATTTTIDLVPTQPGTVPVKSVFGWIIIHQNIGNGIDWELPWADYKAGFGTITSNFWLGLERLHLLTSTADAKCSTIWQIFSVWFVLARLHLLTSGQPYRLRMEMQQESDGLWFSDEYWSFQIGDELTDKYRLNVSGYRGDGGNGLQTGTYRHDGMMFTTYDRDNDLPSNVNCGSARNGGWWFSHCYRVCPTCSGWRHQAHALPEGSLAASRMMIKPTET